LHYTLKLIPERELEAAPSLVTQTPGLQIEVATQYTEAEKSVWVSISRSQLAWRKRGWQSTNEGWRNMIAKEICSNNPRVDLKVFTRITPLADEFNLILEAPRSAASHELMHALKATRSHIRINLHLSP
jgi:hypothetical protein